MIRSPTLLQTGTTPDQAVFTLEEVASQAIASDQVDIGDSFTFSATLDLPGLAEEDRDDLAFEAFGMHLHKGTYMV